ncbi:uncharacterized protein LOC122708546 [Cervus elaphus]|uniref:uncharacterized protein LOC122708546 n=1 Tax=Cervus elaphus TaxID=9860 RepID=UPI001CC27591|nr:uncharacterized protein LOC122708546 [Cervus elaphus]
MGDLARRHTRRSPLYADSLRLRLPPLPTPHPHPACSLLMVALKTDPEWPHERIPGALLYHSGAGIPTPRCSMVSCGVWRRCFPSQEPRAPGGAGPAPSSAPPLGVSRLRPPAARLRRGAGRAARGEQAPCRASTARLAPLPAAGPQNRPQGALPRWPPRVAASRRVPYLLMTPFTQLCKSQNGDGDIVGFFFFSPDLFCITCSNIKPSIYKFSGLQAAGMN